jgi:hypothetical protein
MKHVITRRSLPFAIFWLVGVGIVVWAGGQVDGYKLYVMRVPLPHPYPWSHVLMTIGIQSVEVALFYALIRPESYSRSWIRALLALVLSLALSIFFFFMLMHAPPFAVWHWVWLAFASVVFLTLLGVSVFRRFGEYAA